MTRLAIEVSKDDSSLDADLMQRWSTGADPRAVDQLVRRHGHMVLGVCRRSFRDPADIDDAFQAAFLVFVRKARALSKPDRVAGWLHGVAVRVACRARADRARRREREAPMIESAAPNRPENMEELRRVLDEELVRLPDKYRLPIVLCELDERTLDGAAKLLGWPKGTVAGRLSRGRDLLRRRLSKRKGLALPLFLLGFAAPAAGRAAPPETLVSATIAAASGHALPSTRPAELADAVLDDPEWKLGSIGRFGTLLVALMLFSVVALEVRAAVQGNFSSSQADSAAANGGHTCNYYSKP